MKILIDAGRTMRHMVDKVFATFLGVIGCVISYYVGRGYQKWVHARAEYEVTKAKVPLLRRFKWTLFRAFVLISALATVWLLVMGWNTALPPLSPGPSPGVSAVPAHLPGEKPR